jgi:hypothetical protein
VGQRTRARSLASGPHGVRGLGDSGVWRVLLAGWVELVDRLVGPACNK